MNYYLSAYHTLFVTPCMARINSPHDSAQSCNEAIFIQIYCTARGLKWRMFSHIASHQAIRGEAEFFSRKINTHHILNPPIAALKPTGVELRGYELRKKENNVS